MRRRWPRCRSRSASRSSAHRPSRRTLQRCWQRRYRAAPRNRRCIDRQACESDTDGRAIGAQCPHLADRILHCRIGSTIRVPRQRERPGITARVMPHERVHELRFDAERADGNERHEVHGVSLRQQLNCHPVRRSRAVGLATPKGKARAARWSDCPRSRRIWSAGSPLPLCAGATQRLTGTEERRGLRSNRGTADCLCSERIFTAPRSSRVVWHRRRSTKPEAARNGACRGTPAGPGP